MASDNRYKMRLDAAIRAYTAELVEAAAPPAPEQIVDFRAVMAFAARDENESTRHAS
jgi:hypothetical protein